MKKPIEIRQREINRKVRFLVDGLVAGGLLAYTIIFAIALGVITIG